MTPEVIIVESGGANTASIRIALERLGAQVRLSTRHDDILDATHVILPGVGAAGDAMARLGHLGLPEILRQRSRPVLGICLGMQLLFESSEEDDTIGLGLIPGRVERFTTSPDHPVPHMGWNRLDTIRQHPLLNGIPDRSHVYFVHSYRAPVGPHTVAACEYGTRFAAVVSHGVLHGVQFHPERSAAVGARLLQNFLTLEG